MGWLGQPWDACGAAGHKCDVKRLRAPSLPSHMFTAHFMQKFLNCATVNAASTEETEKEAAAAASTLEGVTGFLKSVVEFPMKLKLLLKIETTYDVPDPTTLRRPTVYEPLPGETGWDRIRAMYTVDEYGLLNPEWTLIIQGFWGGAIGGAGIGALTGGKRAGQTFVDRNEGTLFHNEMAARRSLQDRITFGMMKGAVQWGARTSFFTAFYLFGVTTLSVYKNHTGIQDFVLSGSVTGCLFKFLDGPRACFVGGIMGALLGLTAGGITLPILKLTGTSIEEIRYWHYQARVNKRSEVGSAGSREDEKDAVSRHCDELHGNKLEEKKI